MMCPHVVVLACGALLLTSCGKDEGEHPWSTGLDVTASVQSVSDQARREVCRSLDEHLTDSLDFYKLTRLMCSPGGILRASSTLVCEQLVAQCMAVNAPQPLLFGARIDQQKCMNNLVHCNSPVSALESCINRNVAHVLALIDELTCDRVGDRALMERAARTLGLNNAVMKCEDLSPACQNVIEDAVVR